MITTLDKRRKQMSHSHISRGACLCGDVEFNATMPTMFCAHCHCTMCQRAHGAGYVTWFAIPYSQFELIDPNSQLVIFKSSDHGKRSFCSKCGSTLFCESTIHPDHIDIVLANMKDPIDREPKSHIYFSDKARWSSVNDSLKKLGGPSGVDPLDA